MKKAFKNFFAGLITMMWGVGAMAAFLFAIESIQKISNCSGWIAILHFFTAITSLVIFIIIISILGVGKAKEKKEVYFR